VSPIDPPEGGFEQLARDRDEQRERDLVMAQRAFLAAAERARADEAQHQADRERVAGLFGRPPGRLRRLDVIERR
jgi:hypothetical protein